jgi:hypothetical protein
MFQDTKNTNEPKDPQAGSEPQYSSNLLEIKTAFTKEGFSIFKAQDVPEVAEVFEAAATLDYLKPYANRGQTRGAILLRDLTWQIDAEVREFTEKIESCALKSIMAATLDQPSIELGEVLLNNYSKGESLARHKDGSYRPTLKAVLLFYLTPTSDSALHIEGKNNQVINPFLKGGDCILLSPDLYHWVEEVKTPRRSLLIELKAPEK